LAGREEQLVSQSSGASFLTIPYPKRFSRCHISTRDIKTFWQAVRRGVRQSNLESTKRALFLSATVHCLQLPLLRWLASFTLFHCHWTSIGHVSPIEARIIALLESSIRKEVPRPRVKCGASCIMVQGNAPVICRAKAEIKAPRKHQCFRSKESDTKTTVMSRTTLAIIERINGIGYWSKG